MDYYIDELYEGCVSELNTLYQLLEQEKDELSGCAGKFLQPLLVRHAEALLLIDDEKAQVLEMDLLLQQLDGIQKDLRIIFDV